MNLQPPPQPSYQDYINATFKNPAYTQATQDYNTRVQGLNSLTSQEPGFLQQQTTQLQQNDPQYQALLKGNQAAVSNLYAAPAAAQEQYSNIFNPVARNALVAKAIGNALGQLSGSNNLIKMEGGFQSQKAQTALDLLKQKISSAQAGVTAIEKNRTDLLAQLDKAFTMQKQGQQQNFTNNLALARLAKTGTSSGTDPNKPLTPSQVIALNNAGLNVKLGQTLGEVSGQQPGIVQPKNYKDFVNEYSTMNRMSPSNPASLYNDYLTAQQNYNISENKQQYLDQLRAAAPDIAALLKVPNVSQNNLLTALAQLGANQ